MTALKRFAVIAAVILISLAVLSSAAYIAIEADHDCAGEECLICSRMEACVDLLKSVFTAAAVVAAFAAVTAVFCRLRAFCARSNRPAVYSLSKVRLLN